MADAGRRARADPPGQQLLDRRVHRADRGGRRRHRRRHRGRRRAVPARARRRDRRDQVAATGGRADVRARPRWRTVSSSSAAPTSRCARSTSQTGDVLWSRRDDGRGVRWGGDRRQTTCSRSPASASRAARKRSRTSGVYRFSLARRSRVDVDASTNEPAPPTTPVPEPTRPAHEQECVDEPVHVNFDLTQPPAGVTPVDARSRSRSTRSRWTSQAEGLGDPAAWLRPGSAAAAGGRDALRVSSSPSATTTRPAGWSACSTPTSTARRRDPARRRAPTTGSASSRSTTRRAARRWPRASTGSSPPTSFDPPLAPTSDEGARP